MKTKITKDNRTDLISLTKEEENQIINGLNTNFAQEQYKKLSKEIKQLENKATKLGITILSKQADLRKICPHIETYEEHKHFSAGYDYFSKDVYQTICKFCNKILTEKTNHGNSFG